jgi:2,4-dienoyl-CoA reductase-like NADH-dependent reductase (Old Yellow Enzyme family)
LELISMATLFSNLTLRGLTLRNRIMMSPMCMYSAGDDGVCTGWHRAHYLARAAGGCGLVMVEATAIEARGRISRQDLGIWAGAHVEPLARLVRQVRAGGAAIGIQLAHAGRKAWSSDRGHGPEIPIAPSPLPFAAGWQTPHALDAAAIEQLVAAWQAAARRAHAAAFDVVEIHAAHGYLIHQFLSPLSNHRTGNFGGSGASRQTFLRQVVQAVRQVWPAEKPLFVRLSCTDWAPSGLALEDTIEIARELGRLGVDLVDCSSGGNTPAAPPKLGPGYQVPFAEKIRRAAAIPTAAVGLITAPELADEIVRNERADLIALGRELLRHPHWPLDAAHALGQVVAWPRQYRRARLDPGHPSAPATKVQRS